MIDESHPDEGSEKNLESDSNPDSELPESNDSSSEEHPSEDIDIEVNDVFDESQPDIQEADDIDVESLKPILEGAILAAGEALSIERMQTLFNKNGVPSKADITEALESIQKDCEGRGFELKEVASGWRFQVREDFAIWVNRLWEEKPQKYSRALLETLSLIAYRQPITRGDIEEVRGVAVSSHIIKTLSEREWVKVVGHRDVPGRPALYATTKLFLDYFNLKSLEQLPTLGELKDIDGLNQKLDLDSADEKIFEPIAVSDSDVSDTTERDVDDSSVNDNHVEKVLATEEAEPEERGDEGESLVEENTLKAEDAHKTTQEDSL